LITQARLKELLDYDPATGVFVWRVGLNNRTPEGSVAGAKNRNSYISIGADGLQYKAHRLAWLYMTGEWPCEQIDHINCVKDDNRFENLREASQGENQRNVTKRASNTSGYKCVWWDKKADKWKTSISLDGVRTFLGYFDRIEDAAAAYAEASTRLHRNFGRAA